VIKRSVDDDRAIARLRALCRSWGGNLVLLDRSHFVDLFDEIFRDGKSIYRPISRGFYSSPAAHGHGLHYENKIIYATFEDAHSGRLIHEMGHVFACDLGPEHSDELSWLGWEIATARRVDCYEEWSDQNNGYILGGLSDDAFEWDHTRPLQMRPIIADRLEEARRLGLIDQQDQPKSIR
jgi:hypothetical protein